MLGLVRRVNKKTINLIKFNEKGTKLYLKICYITLYGYE